MKAYVGVHVYIHIFLTSALVGGEWSTSRPCRFTPGERALGTHLIGGWVGPRAGLDDVEKRKFLTPPSSTALSRLFVKDSSYFKLLIHTPEILVVLHNGVT
jgi:hypothetical protein